MKKKKKVSSVLLRRVYLNDIWAGFLKVQIACDLYCKCILYINIYAFVCGGRRNDFNDEESIKATGASKQEEIKFSTASTVKIFVSVNSALEFPVLCVFDRLDSPSELVSQSFGEEFLDRNIEFLREHYRQTRINVILQSIVSVFCLNCHVFRLTIFEVLRATSLLPSRSSA